MIMTSHNQAVPTDLEAKIDQPGQSVCAHYFKFSLITYSWATLQVEETEQRILNKMAECDRYIMQLSRTKAALAAELTRVQTAKLFREALSAARMEACFFISICWL